VLGNGISGIHWRAKSGILTSQVFIGDPKGPRAKPSNSNGDFMADQKLHQLFQRWYADSMHLLRDVILD
jgi:hypothetical protein